ncbi:cysteine sulfinic acid decarboxylase [Hyalella azteca]|uniref:Cysteine sulfinic acid decarboxylase n=1 Tax=Hyalella azteca TaxID=294128 RepID=A0A6A0GRD8_HYAAZ|nr:cysteine sulfinic acid decarboxylase [Hyalella azteca]KAA0185610.1 cysteine sulfinic acid decarboxylase [Hyalella azteca]
MPGFSPVMLDDSVEEKCVLGSKDSTGSKNEESSALGNGLHSNKAEKFSYPDGELIQKVFEIALREKLYGKVDEKEKVIDFKHPAELNKIFDLDMSREGCQSRAEVDEVLERVVRHSVRTQHPHFYNQLFGGIDEVGLAGAWILEAINTNAYTFEAGPALVITERWVLTQMMKLFGWAEGGEGIFCPGGSIANMYSMVLARHHFSPDFKRTGLAASDAPLVLFTSEQCHYSISKSAFWLGFGLDNVVAVATDDHGIMHGAALRDAVRKAREEGKKPFYVNSTAGTTVFGAYDNFNEIADVCKEEGLWMHVDASWGGAAVLSSTHKKLLAGSERADSLCWNPHKMLCVPLQCSMFITKHKGLLHDANCAGATYLFQQDKFYDVSYDTGDMSVQCGRKGDALKVWLMFKIHGMDVLENRIDAAFAASKYLESEVKRREGFELVREGLQCTNVCFWYIPPALRGQTRTPQWWQMLHKVGPLIKEQQVIDGTILVGYQPMTCKKLVNFFRMVNTSHPVPTQAHMDFVLDEIERCGKHLRLEQLQ